MTLSGRTCGSSPHTRGARPLPGSPPPLSRIIPAYAGSTAGLTAASIAVPDHPRIRGEHSRGCRTAPISLGSSPHTRGALEGLPNGADIIRIIPAYAGSTPACPSPPSQRGGDHPRIRGEHMEPNTDAQSEAGSSPHTRGAPHAEPRRRLLRGIIPAYAGSTSWASPASTPVRDHPRIRGEHNHAVLGQCPQGGSSPHTRGALQFRGPFPLAVRIIPAYAGSTPTPTWSKSPYWDHPRIRGEHEP